MSDGAFEITKEMFQTKPTGDGGGMHGVSGLVNNVGDIRASEIEI